MTSQELKNMPEISEKKEWQKPELVIINEIESGKTATGPENSISHS